MAKRKVKLTFPEELIKEPVIYKLGHEFKIITNILQANVTKDSGWVVLEIDGANNEIDKAIDSLRDKGVKVAVHDSSEFIDL
jgi:ABC-type methionine transport system ATPase subunit